MRRYLFSSKHFCLSRRKKGKLMHESHRVERASATTATLGRQAARFSDLTRPLEQLVHVEDPAFYVNPWPIYTRLQREAPVYFYEALNTWIITKYDDVRHVARSPEFFSARHGILLLDGVKHGAGTADLFAGGADFIGLTDPPRHTELRRVMQAPFSPPALASLEPKIAEFSDRLLDHVDAEEPVEWVSAVAARLPVMVIASILGIDHEDEEFLYRARRWSDVVEDVASKDLTPAEMNDAREAFARLDEFITDMFAQKRRRPGDDFLSFLLKERLDGELLSETNLISFTQILLAAGSDTVRALLSQLVVQLASHSDQRDLLTADPALGASVVEETLRFAPPARGFARQVVAPTVLRGQILHPGQRVLMCFDAANRDPDAFEDPHVFDITRPRSRRNVAFGFGTHMCVAAPLARLEGRVLLARLLQRFPSFELACPSDRVESFLRNGFHAVHLHLCPVDGAPRRRRRP
jgi:cytochrome P450